MERTTDPGLRLMKNLPTILKMSPYYRPVVWGGRRLETALNKELPEGENIGAVSYTHLTLTTKA